MKQGAGRPGSCILELKLVLVQELGAGNLIWFLELGARCWSWELELGPRAGTIVFRT